MVWAATERAAGLAHLPAEHGNRMWVNTLSLLSLSTQHFSGFTSNHTGKAKSAQHNYIYFLLFQGPKGPLSIYSASSELDDSQTYLKRQGRQESQEDPARART